MKCSLISFKNVAMWPNLYPTGYASPTLYFSWLWLNCYQFKIRSKLVFANILNLMRDVWISLLYIHETSLFSLKRFFSPISCFSLFDLEIYLFGFFLNLAMGVILFLWNRFLWNPILSLPVLIFATLNFWIHGFANNQFCLKACICWFCFFWHFCLVFVFDFEYVLNFASFDLKPWFWRTILVLLILTCFYCIY